MLLRSLWRVVLFSLAAGLAALNESSPPNEEFGRILQCGACEMSVAQMVFLISQQPQDVLARTGQMEFGNQMEMLCTRLQNSYGVLLDSSGNLTTKWSNEAASYRSQEDWVSGLFKISCAQTYQQFGEVLLASAPGSCQQVGSESICRFNDLVVSVCTQGLGWCVDKREDEPADASVSGRLQATTAPSHECDNDVVQRNDRQESAYCVQENGGPGQGYGDDSTTADWRHGSSSRASAGLESEGSRMHGLHSEDPAGKSKKKGNNKDGSRREKQRSKKAERKPSQGAEKDTPPSDGSATGESSSTGNRVPRDSEQGATVTVEREMSLGQLIRVDVCQCKHEVAALHICIVANRKDCNMRAYYDCLLAVGAPAGSYAALVEGRHGTFLVNVFDMYIGASLALYGEWSEEEVGVMEMNLPPDGVVADVGANIGSMTIPLARRVPRGSVIAWEPQRVVGQLLAANVQLNSLSNVHVRAAVAGDADGERRMIHEVRPTVFANFGGFSVTKKSSEAEEAEGQGWQAVRKERIDSLGLKRLDLLKIDAEGMEGEVVRGAAATIRRDQPVVYAEADRNGTELHQLILSLGPYLCFKHTPLLFNADNYRRETFDLFNNTRSVMMLCISEARPNSVVPSFLLPHKLATPT